MQEFARLFEQVDLNTPHCIYCRCLYAVDESVAATEIMEAEERPQGEECRVLGFWVPGAEVSRRSQRGCTGRLGTVYELWVERRNGRRDSVVACSTCLRKSPQCTINPARDCLLEALSAALLSHNLLKTYSSTVQYMPAALSAALLLWNLCNSALQQYSACLQLCQQPFCCGICVIQHYSSTVHVCSFVSSPSVVESV
jgi:hypothetical protein